MSDAPMKPDPLDQDFAALKAAAKPPSADLMVRVLHDADAVQEAFMTPPAPRRDHLRARFMELIGGWPSMAGLATAGIAGVWIGLSPPAALIAGSQALLYGDAGDALVDMELGFGLSELDGDL